MFSYRIVRTLVVALIVTAMVPARGRAQQSGDGFLFGEPRGTLTLLGGWAAARAQSDIYTFTTGQLTLDRGDFSSLAGSADFAFRLLPRTQAVLSVGIAATHKRSEFRDFVDNNELPIEQTTTFSRAPVTIGIKQYLTATGHRVGRFAWIPNRVAPYVGAGAGFLYYHFKQAGDFVDFETMEVFASQFTSHGWTPTAHALAGIDYSLSARFALTAQTRYQWASAEMSRDFSGFQRIDLSGLATTAGLTIRY